MMPYWLVGWWLWCAGCICMFVKGKSKTIFFPSNTLIYGISRDGSKNLNIHTCEHMILGQLRMGARHAKNAPLSVGWLVSPLMSLFLFNRLEQKKKIRIQIRDLHCLLGLVKLNSECLVYSLGLFRSCCLVWNDICHLYICRPKNKI